MAKKYKPPITHKVKQHIKKKLTEVLPVKVHQVGGGEVILECPYGAGQAFRTHGMAMKVKRRHESKWRHRKRVCRLFKGM